MTSSNDGQAEIDWSLATWEGARREQLRRWSELSLTEMILALEEMEALARQLSSSPSEGIDQS